MNRDPSIDDAPTTEAGFAIAEAVVGGRFRLGERLSWGGMGTVYRAIDIATGHEVAVKLPHIGAAGATELRFDREIKALSTLVCSSVIGYVDHGSREEPYLAMELVHGDPLFKHLQNGAFEKSVALHVARRVASALAAIHLGGWVHRDVKPGNIVVDGSGAIKLLDFGLSRTLDIAEETTAKKGDLVGTLGYMAPEQLHGNPVVDARTDVFSLGVVLFECLTGRRAYRRTVSDIAKNKKEPPLDVHGAGVSGPLSSLIESMVAHDPAQRPADGVETLARMLWLDAPHDVPTRLDEIRAALRHVIRSGKVLLMGAFAGSATPVAATVATLLAEVMAPSDVVVVSCDPAFRNAPHSHASALAALLATRGFHALARRIVKSGSSVAFSSTERERRVIVVLEDAAWCDPVSAMVFRELASDRSILLVIATFPEEGQPTSLDTTPLVKVDAVPPESVTLARLSPLARWVLRASAMFGREVSRDGVMHLVAGTEAHDVGYVLDHLSARHILRARPRSRDFTFASSFFLDAARRLATPAETRLGSELAQTFRATHFPDEAPTGVWAIASEEACAGLGRPNTESR